MALKITLKPNERIILGGAVVVNGETKCELLIENNTTLLREKDILREEDANSPCRRIYFTIQLMYIDTEKLAIHHQMYWKLVKELLEAVPSTIGLIDQINEHIVSGRYYQALKLASKLIEYEQEVISSV
jgi:flagellar protein FlbT